jgi:hypothetical protein
MKGERGLLRLGERLIAKACRRLPANERDERYAEWTAELPAILDDPDIRFAWHRTVRMLRYSADIAWRFSRPSPPQTRRFIMSGWFIFNLGLLGYDVWSTVRNPHSWEAYLNTALGVTTVALLMIYWRKLVGPARRPS